MLERTNYRRFRRNGERYLKVTEINVGCTITRLYIYKGKEIILLEETRSR